MFEKQKMGKTCSAKEIIVTQKLVAISQYVEHYSKYETKF